MRRHIRTSMGLWAAMAIGLLALGAAGQAQATTGGCFLPSVAVDILLDTMEEADFDEEVGRCKRQCGQILEMCHRVCKWSERCLEAFITGAFKFERIDCKNEGEGAEECKDSARSDREEFLDFLSGDKEGARAGCANFHTECLFFCEGDV